MKLVNERLVRGTTLAFRSWLLDRGPTLFVAVKLFHAKHVLNFSLRLNIGFPGRAFYEKVYREKRRRSTGQQLETKSGRGSANNSLIICHNRSLSSFVGLHRVIFFVLLGRR